MPSRNPDRVSPDPAASGPEAPALAAEVRELSVDLPSRERSYAPPATVLDHLSFTVPSGQVTALVGTNGAGKTTTLRALIGALPFTTGRLEVLGTAMGSAAVGSPPGVVTVPDVPAYPGHWTAHHLARLHRDLDPGFDARRMGARLAAHGIPLTQEVDRLSRGQVTQLAMSAALARSPRLLILDEPFARLDPLARTDLLDELRSLMAAEGRSILLATHDLEGMDRFVDHLVVIAAGQCLIEGEVESLCEEYLLLEHAPADGGGRSRPRALAGSPLIGASSLGGITRALVHVEDAAGLPPTTDLRRPALSELITHWLRAASATTDSTTTPREEP